MRSWLALLLTAPVVMHLMLGCIAHPAQAAATRCSSEADHDHEGHCHEHEPAHAEPAPNSEVPLPAELPCNDCEHDVCLSILSSKVNVSAPSSAASLPVMAIPPAARVRPTQRAGWWDDSMRAHAALHPDVLCRVLLI
jgi:hypothetical protein